MPNINDGVATGDGTCTVGLFTPDGPGPWPGVVMLPDAGGVRDIFGQMAARLADFGYAVLLPDVYYREGDWAPFDMASAFTDAPERKRIMSMITSLTSERINTDAAAFFDYLTGRPEVTGQRFGVCGYCMGGRMSMVMAGRQPNRVAAAASFHGGGMITDSPESPHLLVRRISAMVYLGGAENDPLFTNEDAEQLAKMLTAAGVTHRIEWYQAAHGFAVPDNPSYDAAAAARHWTALTNVLGAALPG